MHASAFAEEADQAASLVAIGGTVLGVGVASHLMRAWWDPLTDTFVAVPVFYALAVFAAGLAALLLTVRARITDNDRLRWLVSGLAVAGTAIAFQGLEIADLSRVPELATVSGTATLYWLWHGGLAVFAIGGALAPQRQRLRRGLLVLYAFLFVLVLFEPAWEVLPAVVTPDGEFTALYRPIMLAVAALTAVAVVAWTWVHGRSATRPDVWIVIMLVLSGLNLLYLSQATSWERSVWWTSPELRAAPLLALAGGLLADGVRLVGLLHRHERSLREQLGREVEQAIHANEPTATDADAAARIRVTIDDRAFFAVFQPVVSLQTGEVLSVEALTRFTGEPSRTPDRWFDEAHAVGLGVELEFATLHVALAGAAVLPPAVALSMNASPALLGDPRLLTLLDERTDRRPLIVELTEHAAIEDYSQLDDVLGQLRRRGVRVAIDDAGAGFSSLRHVVRLKPDVIKLDISLTRGIHRDPVRHALAASLTDFAHRTATTLIAEGVEEEAELAVLCELGVDAAQGYLLCRPLPVDELPADVLDGTRHAAHLRRVEARLARSASRARPASSTPRSA